VVKDKEILSLLCDTSIVDKKELGTDFGSGQGGAPDIDDDLENEINPLGKKSADASKGNRAAKAKDPGGLFEEDDEAEGDQFMATIPCQAVINNMKPSTYKPSKADTAAPEATLDLEYVYGYRCHDTRNNLFYSHDSTKLLYHAAALGIIYDKATNT
jgi:microtubule-associated protein-like 6